MTSGRVPTQPDRDAEWFREWMPPEEDRARYTSRPWQPGEPRWFRSPNVVCLEAWRERKANTGANANHDRNS
jgi:hypothetical protein